MKNALLVLTLLYLSSCVPVAVAGLAVAGHASSNKTKQKWTADFNQNNIEREKQHLPPLDWCEEVFKFNKSWAKKDKACKAKLVAERKI